MIILLQKTCKNICFWPVAFNGNFLESYLKLGKYTNPDFAHTFVNMRNTAFAPSI